MGKYRSTIPHERHYPIDSEGIPLHTWMVRLPESRLDDSKEHNYNLHHLSFEYKKMSRLLITKAFADLLSMHEMMLKDQHNMGRLALHTLWLPPQPPTIQQAMSRVDDAYWAEEKLQIRDPSTKKYIEYPITAEHMNLMQEEYNRISP